MKIALLTGPSGSGKTFVADHLQREVDCLSYDRLMRDSVERTFPKHSDKWDKQVWLDNGPRLDLVAAFRDALTWSGKGPLLVEGWQLRERIWRQAILDLAAARADGPTAARLFVIQPTLEVLLAQRAESRHEYHRRNATLADCQRQIAIHQQLSVEQPWDGKLVLLSTKEEALRAVRDFLSSP